MPRSRPGKRPHARDNRHAGTGAGLARLSEEDLYEELRGEDNAFVLILDGVEDPHNLGACLRAADAAGVRAVIAPKRHAAPVTDTVRRVACGAAENVPLVQVTNLARAMRTLKEECGLRLVGTADESDALLFDIDLTGPLGLVMGAEGKGMRHLTAEHCDCLARIPMLGSVDCLNVSVATGVCLFEAVRQRLQRDV